MKILLFTVILVAFAAARLPAADTDPAATVINSLGIDLLKKTDTSGENVVLSPYSIQQGLAMTYAGAGGATRQEMAKTFYYPQDDAILNTSFASLQKELEAIQKETVDKAAAWAKSTSPRFDTEENESKEPITLNLANRLFAQSGFEYRKPFLDLLQDTYKAPLERVDFADDPVKATDRINAWVEEQTLNRIHNILPGNAITTDTAIVLVNALYLKAQWNVGFSVSNTEPLPFHIKGGATEDVPMMQAFDMELGFSQRDGFSALTIPYIGSGLQFLVLLPDKVDGLPALEAKLTPRMLASCTSLKTYWTDLAMPKFKIEAPVICLSKQLEALGLTSAFNDSANFDRMTPRQIHVAEVFHKIFLSIDEHGTESSASTAISLAAGDGDAGQHVNVDHPFLFAIQDCKSGACLFLGCVTDPR